ncbi:MAG: SH3 domain-containing protein [Firmicutes bacterium]|nr:SH3 domain-containing protein [Bacillota bacterium]
MDKSINASLIRLSEAMRASLPNSNFTNIGKVMRASLSNDSLMGINASLIRLSEAMRASLPNSNFTNISKLMRVSLSNDSLMGIRQGISLILKNDELMSDIDFNKVHLDTNGTLSYCDEIIELDDTIQEIEVLSSKGTTIQERISNTIDNMKKKQIVILFLITFLIFQPIQEYYNNWATATIEKAIDSIKLSLVNNVSAKSVSVKKVVRNEVSTSINDDILKSYIDNNYRYVSIDCLNVRLSNSINSKIIGDLHLGEVVKIVNKQRNWTLIEFKDENQENYIKGWIFTRYIKRFD